MFGVVDSFALLPRCLALSPKPQVKLLVEVDALRTHVVVWPTEVNPASLLIAYVTTAIAGVDMMRVKTKGSATHKAAWITLIGKKALTSH